MSLWFSNLSIKLIHHRDTEAQRKKMNKSVQYQNKKINYQSIGKGKAVLLVHGFGEDGTIWEKQIDFHKHNFHLLIPDLPGSGGSELIEDVSMEGMAEVLHEIIHEEDVDSCSMFGHSMGGYITLAFAEKYWNHLDAFGLIHSTAFADSREKIETRKKGIEFINQHGTFEFLKTTIPNLFSSNSKSQLKDSINEFINSQSSFTPDTLIAYYEAMINRPDRTLVLKNTKTPVLIIAGEEDNAVSLHDILKQSHLPDHCSFHILNNSGHMGMMEEPQRMNMLIDVFLKEIVSNSQ